MFSILSQGIGGLGIFFAGMYLLSENLKKLSGRRFRQAVAAWTKTLWAGLLWGFATGTVMQSTPAITFIVVSMLGSGLLTVNSGLAIIIGCNIGTTLLVVIATLNIHLFVLVMLGIAGLSFASARLAPARTLLLAIFGIGLVFLGLQMLQEAAGPLAAEPVRNLMAGVGSSYWLAFGIGAVLSFVTQSTNSVALLSITLASAGVLSFEQCVMAIYGANVGASVLTYVLSAGLKGRQRQVAMYQVAFNIVAALVMVPLFYLEIYGGVPLAIALAKALSAEPALQLAYIHVIFNTGGAIALIPFVGIAGRILARLYPPPPEENDARPQFIYEQAIQEPETALDLVAREQQRLASYLPLLLDIARTAPKDATTAIARRREVIASLAVVIDEFLDRLGETQLAPSAYERLNQALNVQRILDGLSETLADLARTVVGAGANPTTRRLMDSIVEGLDAVLITLVEAMGPDGEDDRALLRHMTGDRGALMRRLREEYLASDANLAAADKMTILTITNLTERASWLINRLGEALRGTRVNRGRAGRRRSCDRMSAGATGPVLTLRLPNRLAAIGESAEEIARFCAARGVPQAAIGHLNLALDEAMTNTIEYGWPDGGDHELALTIVIDDGAVVAEISDDGVAFDPLKIPPPDLESDLESRPVGGLGVHFVKTLMDDVAYRRDGDRNVLTMRKRFATGDRRPAGVLPRIISPGI